MPDGPLTLLQLTHQGDGTGSTQSILSLSQHLARRGHRVLVGCRAGTLLARQAGASGLDVRPLDFTRLGSLAAAVADLVRREGVDVVNSHDTRDRRACTWLRWRRRLGLMGAGGLLCFAIDTLIVALFPLLVFYKNAFTDVVGTFLGLVAFVGAPVIIWFALTFRELQGWLPSLRSRPSPSR